MYWLEDISYSSCEVKVSDGLMFLLITQFNERKRNKCVIKGIQNTNIFPKNCCTVWPVFEDENLVPEIQMDGDTKCTCRDWEEMQSMIAHDGTEQPSVASCRSVALNRTLNRTRSEILSNQAWANEALDRKARNIVVFLSDQAP